MKGAPDLIAAQKVADAIGTVHHEINFTIQEGLDALRNVIYHIETYDTTTIRASTPMYFLGTLYIKSMGIKMVLSGEEATKSSAVICTSTKPRMRVNFMKKPLEN